MSENNWKKRDGIVYSTNENFEYTTNDPAEEPDTLKPEEQKLTVRLDTSNRKGKQVTLVQGFTGKTGDLEDLAKVIKTKCSVGGSVKDREVIIQGDLRVKITELLLSLGYKVKKI
jgi:translation initiation factor 1